MRERYPKPKAKVDGWHSAFAQTPGTKGHYEVWFQEYKFTAEYDGQRWYSERIGFFNPRFWRKLNGQSIVNNGEQQTSGS